MAFKLTSFQKRLISAAVLAPVSFMIIWHGGWIFALFTGIWAAVAYYEWIHLSLKTDHKLLFLVLGTFYVGLCFWCCYLLGSQFSPEIPLLFICCVWASDVGAYFTGKAIGGPKLAAGISPNKTWAGFIGAFVCPALLCLAFFYSLRGWTIVPAEIIAAIVAGVVIGIVGQAGDLVISWVKRCAGVKDSGHLIPGHGGVLDRVDALMLSAPAFLLIVRGFADVFLR